MPTALFLQPHYQLGRYGRKMSAIVAAVASLVGVVIGAVLSPWLQRRAEMRKAFYEALEALALVTASQNWPSKTATDGIEDASASLELQRRMHEEFLSSLLEARRALAQVAPLCPEIRPYLSHWKDIQSSEVQDELEAILRRGLRRRILVPFR